MYKLSKRSMSRMEGVHPELILIFMEAIKYSPIDFGIPRDGGVRTSERQHELFCDPDVKTKADGYVDLSKHQIKTGEHFGKAIDFYAYIGGLASWDRVHLTMVAATILSTAKRLKRQGKITIDLKWGATFGALYYRGWDLEHIEIA